MLSLFKVLGPSSIDSSMYISQCQCQLTKSSSMKKVHLWIMLTVQWGHLYQFKCNQLGKTGAACRYHANITIKITLKVKRGNGGMQLVLGKASLTYPALWVKRYVEVSCKEFDNEDCKGEVRETKMLPECQD